MCHLETQKLKFEPNILFCVTGILTIVLLSDKLQINLGIRGLVIFTYIQSTIRNKTIRPARLTKKIAKLQYLAKLSKIIVRHRVRY